MKMQIKLILNVSFSKVAIKLNSIRKFHQTTILENSHASLSTQGTILNLKLK